MTMARATKAKSRTLFGVSMPTSAGPLARQLPSIQGRQKYSTGSENIQHPSPALMEGERQLTALKTLEKQRDEGDHNLSCGKKVDPSRISAVNTEYSIVEGQNTEFPKALLYWKKLVDDIRSLLADIRGYSRPG